MPRTLPRNSTPIINPIIEGLCKARLSSYEFNIVMAVIRKTYGWNKSTDWISGSQLANLTDIATPNCFKAVRQLIRRNILKKHGSKLGINKTVSTWIVSKQIVSKQIVGTIQIDSQDYPDRYTQKKLLQKKPIQKIAIVKKFTHYQAEYDSLYSLASEYGVELDFTSRGWYDLFRKYEESDIREQAAKASQWIIDKYPSKAVIDKNLRISRLEKFLDGCDKILTP